MNPNATSNPAVSDALRRAASVHARHRALAFLLRSALGLAAAVPLMMLADVLFHFSDRVRLAGSLGLVALAMAAVVVAFGLGCFVRPPLLRVARLLESRNPQLGSKLVNILQLEADAGNEAAAPLTRGLARRAVADAASSLDLAALPPLARDPRLPRKALHAVAAVFLLAVLALSGGRMVRNEWLRFLDPFGDHPPFSLTYLEILNPAPGHRVLYGDACRVEVRATGHQPRELFLTASPLGGESAPVTVPLFARGDGTFVARLENVRHAMELTAHTADHGSRSHRRLLEVILTPQVEAAVARVEPPAYTGLPARENAWRFTALQALEGSKVQFRIRSNRPLGEGSVQFESDAVSTLPLAPVPEGPENEARVDLAAEKSGRLTFSLVDAAGNAAAETPTATLTVTRDLAPAIAITAPDQDALVVEGLAVPLVVDATDDYGLRSVRLHVAINDTFLPVEPTTFDKPGVRRHRIEHTLDLTKLGTSAGDRIVVFAEAVDIRPEPQISRTVTRRMEVITEAEYNKRLREQVDVAMIAGKYEDLLNRFEHLIEEQKRIEEKLAALREKAANLPDAERDLAEFSQAFSDQTQLNERLEGMAEEMEEFGRDNPVYDFEKELREKLRAQAGVIRESVKTNRAEAEQAIEQGPPPPSAPTPDMIDGLEKAATAQRERLQGGNDRANEDIRETLQDLARLHELMKDFNRFEQLTEEQRELAEQSKAYQDKPQLNAEDRLAMRDMGARQRELARKLEQLEKKLRPDADAAQQEFPKAAKSAEQLADQMDAAGMSGLARTAAQSMLDSKGGEAHAQARNLHEEMDRLLCDACQSSQQGVADGLDRALRLQRGMKPGDSLRQMLLSKRFRPLPAEGQSGAGLGGFMAFSAMDGSPMMVGGESLMDGPIDRAISGRGNGDGSGQPGAPTARLDAPDRANVDAESARRTSTPGSSTLLLEYEKIADAYFRRLTTKP